MPENKILPHRRSLPDTTFKALILYGLFFICSCAHTSAPEVSFTSGPSDSIRQSPDLTVAAASALENPESDDAGQDSYEEDPFEEDPFEKDPFDSAGPKDDADVEISDPLSGLNRVIFHINDKLYFWVLRPVAKGYRFVMPTPIRIGIQNFFTNLLGPLRFVNCALQGKGEAADSELVRFVMNSTVGVLGFGNPAKNYPELALHDEDFGQTFAHWGIGNGFYIVIPILGPSTLRDSIGLIGDYFLKPVSYVKPVETGLAIWAVDNVNATSFRIGDYESLRNAALDPYQAFRNAYIQHRKKQVAK